MLRGRLASGGRIMANCGGPPSAGDQASVLAWEATVLRIRAAMAAAFSEDVWSKQLEDAGRNVLLMTGPRPDVEAWRRALPLQLRRCADGWHQ
eukprot:SM000014S00328  [mRNA]  locus=s14:773036:773314:+ [translate_table: standard]